MGYELYRLLSTVTPSMSSAKSMPTKKKKSPTLDKMNGEPEVIDLDEEEKHMELLIGKLFLWLLHRVPFGFKKSVLSHLKKSLFTELLKRRK